MSIFAKNLTDRADRIKFLQYELNKSSGKLKELDSDLRNLNLSHAQICKKIESDKAAIDEYIKTLKAELKKITH